MTTPNVLLIITDEHRHDCLGAAGNTDIRTPALDRLAADGTFHANAFCTYPVCAPSRYSIMTGRYAHEHRGIGNAGTIGSEVQTFPELLRAAGYRTTAVGKMHLTPPYLDIGFERMILSEQNGEGRYVDDYHRHLRRHGMVDRVDLVDQVDRYRKRAPQSYWDSFGADPSDLPVEFHSTTWTGDRAVEELARWQPDEPNLLVASFIKPHHPFDPPEPWDQQYDAAALKLLPGWTDECLERDLAMDRGYFPHAGLSEDRLRRVMAHYYATISHIDDQVARMLAQLAESGLYDDTLVIFTSDHGDYMGFHHLLLKGGHLYDPLARVPLIVKYPGDRNCSRTDRRLVSQLDLAPTILGWAGIPNAMPGYVLSDQDRRRDHVVSENLGPTRQFMVRSERYKLLQSQDGSLFFDLESDPFEITDLSASERHRDEIERHRAALGTVVDPCGDYRPTVQTDRPVIGGPNVPVDPESAAEMEAWMERMHSAIGEERRP